MTVPLLKIFPHALRHRIDSLSQVPSRSAHQSSLQGSFSMSSENGGPLTISLMPLELILMIACKLPPSSRATLALTCKRFWNAIPRRVSTASLSFDDPERLCLGIPREMPSNFQDPPMSDPQLFQPERWKFLRLLERDISDQWLLCFDCFILHPRHAFVKPKTSLVPWLKSCGGLLNSRARPRSCRYLSPATQDQETGSYSLSGVVDLCPCVHLTPAKRERIESLRDELTQNGLCGKNNRYGHSCLQVYDDVELKVSLVPFLYEKDGQLGFRFHYRRTSPVGSSSVCPRMLCPHISLDTLIKTFSRCRDRHPEMFVCATCRRLRCCPECHTTVFGFAKDTESTSGTISYFVSLERRLDKKLWNKHLVFPFARQRQYESIRRGPNWKLWC